MYVCDRERMYDHHSVCIFVAVCAVIYLFFLYVELLSELLTVDFAHWLSLQRMEEESMEMRMNAETQQKMVSSLRDEQSKLGRQLTQLRLAIQEKDDRIQ